MSKEYSFAVMPSVSISRSRFARKSQHKTSFNLGDIVPVYLDEVLPGDTRSIDMAGLIRMSTPIAPIMDNIYIDYFAFFVPNRLVWTHWKAFMGENEASSGIPSVQYSVPKVNNPSSTSTPTLGCLADYFGLPLHLLRNSDISALPFRGYYLIYNEWFRDQNLIAPKAIQKGDTNEVIVSTSSYGISYYGLEKAAKLSDYFTRALPYAQKGQPVSIPLGTTADVKMLADAAVNIPANSTLTLKNAGPLPTTGTSNINVSGSGFSVGTVNGSGLIADLSSATAATINQLRYAFQLQKFLEKDALYGSRYWEILAAHFGIKAPDASLQRPEYLGGYRQRVNIDQVLSTADYDDTNQTQVGKTGANSVSGFKSSIFTKSFTEHGFIFILAVARHDQTYAQGINRMWSRTNRYDYYFPVFANLGAQDIKLKEIYAQGIAADDGIFGYQEAWAEYRYKPSIATGLLNPNATGALDYWTLTNKFAAAPTLGKAFIQQGRDNIQRALVSGSNGPDFIADFYFEDIAVRPMPMYSIPGLIDHH